MTVEVIAFLVLLALLLGGGMIGAGILKKIKFPTLIGFILIGMIAGPYGLAIVDDVDLINLLADLGIILLLFVVGLEFSLQKLCKAGIKPIVVGMSEPSRLEEGDEICPIYNKSKSKGCRRRIY